MTRIKAAAAYKRIDLESAVASADKHELITLLFKALIGALAGVEVHHHHNNNEQVREYLTKACRILAGLQGSLDYERGGDIAVLCPTNPMVEKYAAVLRAQGLRVRLQADGWFSSRPVQIAWHALAYLANPADRHEERQHRVDEHDGRRRLRFRRAALDVDESHDARNQSEQADLDGSRSRLLIQ